MLAMVMSLHIATVICAGDFDRDKESKLPISCEIKNDDDCMHVEVKDINLRSW